MLMARAPAPGQSSTPVITNNENLAVFLSIVCDSSRDSPHWLHGAKSRTAAAELAGRRRVRFVELNVAASTFAAAQLVRTVRFSRVPDDAGLRQPDFELVGRARFAAV